MRLGKFSNMRLAALATMFAASFSARAQAMPAHRTLDPNLQAAAERILSQSRAPAAAIVVSDVHTGRILVWASRGSVDQVTAPVAPSASLFKVVTATALLEGGVAPSAEECFTGGEHGINASDIAGTGRAGVCVPFSQAVGRSINVVIARLALRHLSQTMLRETASNLGFGAPLPIDAIAPASDVVIPDDRLGMARAAAGFWNGHLSPLGALYVMQTIANRGEKIRMHLHRESESNPVARVSLGTAMRPETADALRRMLETTTTSGTCAKAFRNADGTRALSGITVAAKTGTLIGGKPTRMYSWFAGFAPSTHPEIAVAVLLADDVTWWMKGNVAGRKMLEAYFAKSAIARRGRAAPVHQR
jgi:penicillin-binding protein A